MRVKKRIGRKVRPASGIRWSAKGNRRLPRTRRVVARYNLGIPEAERLRDGQWVRAGTGHMNSLMRTV
jgi:hypothetical protein